MSTNIDRDQTILGFPLLKVRNVLKAWRYGRTTDARDIALRKDVDLNQCTIMVRLEELRIGASSDPRIESAWEAAARASASIQTEANSRRLVKLMHKQKARALARERSECVSALGRLSSLRSLDSRCDD